MVAEAAFHSIHGSFRKTTPMIADRLLPSFAALATDCPNRQVARQRATAGIAVLSDLCITLRGNNRFHPSFLQRLVNLPFIIGAVAIKRLHSAGHLIQQVVHLAGVVATVFRKGFRFDFVRIWIDRQMQLLPDATFRFAVLTHFPLAFAENLRELRGATSEQRAIVSEAHARFIAAIIAHQTLLRAAWSTGEG